jgi:hypothetical protein
MNQSNPTDRKAALGKLANNGIDVLALQTTLSRSDSNIRLVPKQVQRLIEKEEWREFILGGHPDEVFRWGPADFRRFIQDPRPAGCETPLHVLERLLRDTDAWEAFLELTRGNPGAQSGDVRNPSGTNQHTEEGRMNHDNVTNNPLPSPGSSSATNQHTDEARINRYNITDNPPPSEEARTNHYNITDCPPPSPDPSRDYFRESRQGTSVSYTLRRLKKQRPDLYERVKAQELSANQAAVLAGFREKSITLPADP